ncbi:MAG: monovalent cation/H(+) antiporter subunit G [Methylococcales bacterium]
MTEIIQHYIGNIAIIAGIFFLFIGSIGLIRLPDFYTRLHAVSKTDTLGIGLIFFGLLFYAGPTMVGIKLILIVFFIFFTSPVSSHALAKAAFRGGLQPYKVENKQEPTKSAQENRPDD